MTKSDRKQVKVAYKMEMGYYNPNCNYHFEEGMNHVYQCVSTPDYSRSHGMDDTILYDYYEVNHVTSKEFKGDLCLYYGNHLCPITQVAYPLGIVQPVEGIQIHYDGVQGPCIPKWIRRLFNRYQFNEFVKLARHGQGTTITFVPEKEYYNDNTGDYELWYPCLVMVTEPYSSQDWYCDQSVYILNAIYTDHIKFPKGVFTVHPTPFGPRSVVRPLTTHERENIRDDYTHCLDCV